MDTRSAGGPFANATQQDYSGISPATVPDDAIAIFGNLTAVYPTFSGWLTIFPKGVALPPVSSVNFTPGSIVANSFFVGLGTGGNAGMFTVRPDSGGVAGTVNYIVDITAYVQ